MRFDCFTKNTKDVHSSIRGVTKVVKAVANEERYVYEDIILNSVQITRCKSNNPIKSTKIPLENLINI